MEFEATTTASGADSRPPLSPAERLLQKPHIRWGRTPSNLDRSFALACPLTLAGEAVDNDRVAVDYGIDARKGAAMFLMLRERAHAASSRLARCFGLACAILGFGSVAFSANVTLEWDANTEPSLGGYKLYYGPSGSYGTTVDVGNITTFTVSGLVPGSTYYFAVTAYNTTRTIESGFSNQVSTTIAAPPISTPQASALSGVAPLAVSFTDLSTGNITSRLWSFGDGTTSTATNPSHTYAAPADYSVTLTVTGPGGSDTEGLSIQVCCTITLADVAVDFGSNGLWSYGSSSWTFRSAWNPLDVERWSRGIAVAFGAGKGTYTFDGIRWNYLTSLNPTSMVAWNDKLVLGLGASNGLWTYGASGWLQLSIWDPQLVAAWGNKLAVAFGSGRGLWYYDDSGWHSMTTWDPYSIEPVQNNLVAAFNGGRGLWRYSGGGWSQLTAAEPVLIKASGATLYASFGAAGGIWRHDGSAWTTLTGWAPYDMEIWQGKLLASFDAGRGLWQFTGSSWVAGHGFGDGGPGRNAESPLRHHGRGNRSLSIQWKRLDFSEWLDSPGNGFDEARPLSCWRVDRSTGRSVSNRIPLRPAPPHGPRLHVSCIAAAVCTSVPVRRLQEPWTRIDRNARM